MINLFALQCSALLGESLGALYIALKDGVPSNFSVNKHRDHVPCSHVPTPTLSTYAHTYVPWTPKGSFAGVTPYTMHGFIHK